MPSVKAPAKVLVTGANGYIAAWIIRTLLVRGFSVRGTVRAESKSTHLRNLFKNELEKRQLEFVLVSDMKDPGAFDEAVKGVDAIIHTASPVSLNADDPNELIEPAVKGTVGILESASKFAGPQLKRIVITSSSAAVLNTPYAGTFDERSWNEGCLIEVREKGKEASQMGKYCASKTLAEKAAWDFVSKHGLSLTWDLVTICPPYVFGPILHEASSLSALDTTKALFYQALFSKNAVPEDVAKVQGNWVDVRDCAEGHIRALEVPSAGGERFMLSSGPWVWQDWYDTANELKIPGLEFPINILHADYRIIYDAGKARRMLGMDFRNMRETLKDIIANYITLFPPEKTEKIERLADNLSDIN